MWPIPDKKVFEYLQEATKPTTVIYKGAIGLAENVIGKDGSIAMRICNEIFAGTLSNDFANLLFLHPPIFPGSRSKYF